MTENELEIMQTNLDIKKNQMKNNTDIMSVVKNEETALLETKEVKEVSRKFGEERIKADLASEASKIRQQNIETSEKVFDAETREKRLEHLRAELDLDHKYRMATLKEDNLHKQMLDKRRKLVEKYGYLYDMSAENCVEKFDGKNETYLCPKDFSFSPFVNKVRQFGRNVSKLDKPILQTLKWGVIVGCIVTAYLILKHFNIIK